MGVAGVTNRVPAASTKVGEPTATAVTGGVASINAVVESVTSTFPTRSPLW